MDTMTDTSESCKQIVISVPILKNILYFIPLRSGNIVLGLAGAIFYFVICVCLIIKYSVDPFGRLDKIIYGSIIVLSFIHSIGCGVFVVGIVQKKHKFIYPWLWTHTLLTANIVFGYLVFRVTPEVLSFLINWFLLQVYIWLCGFSIYERIRKRNIVFSTVPLTSNDKYSEVFSSVKQSDANWPLLGTKQKCNSVKIKIHEPLK